MTKNTVIALIAIIIVAAAAVGAYFLLSDNDKGDKTDITGTYTLVEGQHAFMTEGEDPVYEEIEGKKLTIESCDGNHVKIKWGNYTLSGTYSNGDMWFGGYFESNGSTYIRNGHGYVKDGVFYYSSIAGDQNGEHSFACAAVFAKEGKTPSKITSPLKEGDFFKQISKTRTIDGACEDISGSNNDTVSVKSVNKGIYLLESKTESSGSVKTYMRFAVMTGEKTFLTGYGEYTRFVHRYVDGDLMITNQSCEMDGKRVAFTTVLSKGTDLPIYDIPDLRGKVYNGTTYECHSNGKTATLSSSFIFADGERCYAYVPFMIGGISTLKTVQLIPTDNGTLMFFSCTYEFNGKEYLEYCNGKISKDLKTMEFYSNTYCKDGSYLSSKNVYKLANGDNELIGSYVAKSCEIADGSDIFKIDIENSYGYYFAITSVNGKIATGIFNDKEFVSELDDNMMSFAYKSSATGYSLYCDAIITKGEGCLIRTYGSSSNDECGVASITSMTLSGKDSAPAIPTKKVIVEAGESFTTFGAVKRVDGKDVTVTELGQKLECLKSSNGLYIFKLTDNGKEYILSGRWASDENVLRLGGYAKGSMTFNFNLHDDFICLDRESMSKDGVHSVITYRMSDDGKERTIIDIESIDGKTYKGEIQLGTIFNGVLKVTKMNVTVKIVNQKQAILTLSEGFNVDAHLLVNEDGKFKMNFYDSYEVDGTTYYYEVYGSFSDDNNTLVVEGLGKTRSSDNAYSSFIAILKT